MKKEKIERICREAGMRPELRQPLKDAEVFVADGFSLPPHFAFHKFGLTQRDYPFGCYATLWWLSKKEDQLDIGQPIFFDVHHNPELDQTSRKHARINAALKEAAQFLERRKRNARPH